MRQKHLLSFILLITQAIYCHDCTIEPTLDAVDFFIFAVIWPSSNYEIKKGKLRLKHPMKDFTIHGLWPKFNDGKIVLYPKKNYFNKKQLPKNLLHDMNSHWIASRKGISPANFWRHEWSKHGSISGFSQEEYFAHSIDFYMKNIQDKIKRKLRRHGIIPSNKRRYSLAHIEKILGPSVNVKIIYNEQQEPILSELQFCIAKDLCTFIPRPSAEEYFYTAENQGRLNNVLFPRPHIPQKKIKHS